LQAAVASSAGQPLVAPLPQQQQQQQRWRSRQRSAQRQFRQLAALGQQQQQVVADLTAPLLPSSSSSRAGGSSSRSQSRGVPIPAHMLPIPQLTPVQSVVSSDGSLSTANGGAS
jgi:hypothetical protein